MRIEGAALLDRVDERLTELEAHVAQIDMVQQLILRLLSIMHPLSSALSQYGATATQERELTDYLDQLAGRVSSLERANRPTFDEFRMHIGEILPAMRDDGEFLRLIIDTLKVERSAYRGLHEYMVGQGWIGRVAAKS